MPNDTDNKAISILLGVVVFLLIITAGIGFTSTHQSPTLSEANAAGSEAKTRTVPITYTMPPLAVVPYHPATTKPQEPAIFYNHFGQLIYVPDLPDQKLNPAPDDQTNSAGQKANLGVSRSATVSDHSASGLVLPKPGGTLQGPVSPETGSAIHGPLPPVLDDPNAPAPGTLAGLAKGPIAPAPALGGSPIFETNRAMGTSSVHLPLASGAGNSATPDFGAGGQGQNDANAGVPSIKLPTKAASAAFLTHHFEISPISAAMGRMNVLEVVDVTPGGSPGFPVLVYARVNSSLLPTPVQVVYQLNADSGKVSDLTARW